MPEQRSSTVADSVPTEDLRPIDVVGRTRGGDPELLGSRCPACRQRAFPARRRCAQCGHSPPDEISLGREGVLYAFSTVHVSAADEVPYTLGFIDLPGDIRVLARLLGSVAGFGIGDAVVLATRSDGRWGFEKAPARAVRND